MKYQRNPQTNLQIRIIKKKSLRGRKDFQCRYVYQYQTFLLDNAEALWKNMDRRKYPAMYCNYYWGSMFPSNEIASMGAQASGSSLMEGVARMMVTPEK